MKGEQPFRIVQDTWNKGHPTETRIFARDIHEHFCKKPGCKFYNKHAQQGVCHSTQPYLASDWKHIERALQHGQGALDEVKRMYRDKSTKKYVAHLESSYAMQWSNESFMMDNLIYLRKELALAQLKLKRK